MADENNAGSIEQVASDVQSDVQAALEKDPNVQLAKRVEENLREANVDDPTKAPVGTSPVEDKEYQEAKSRVANALKERNKVFKERESVRQEAEAIKSEAMKAKAQLDAQMSEFRNTMAGFQRWQADMRTNPVKALRAIGIDPEEFIMGIAQEGTPESRVQTKLREQEEKLREFDEWKRSQAEERSRREREMQETQAKDFRNKVESDFIGLATSDKYSNVKKMLEMGLISRKSLMQEGDEIADQYRESTKGEEASLDDILTYIDTNFASAIGKLSGTNQVKRSTDDGTPSQGASGKTLSQEDAGERRALSRDLRSADSDERREAAKNAVKAVLSKTKKSEE